LPAMHYEGNIIRPPSEANSIILQVTVGCSHNKCIFCGAYKDVLFTIKNDEIIDKDIDFAAHYCRRQNKVFLADGDALIIPQKRLIDILSRIRSKLNWVKRIRLYGNAKSILMKSVEELEELKQYGLDRIYMGLESGSDEALTFLRKGADAASMIEAGRNVRKAGIFLSVTVLLGIAGKEKSEEHAIQTGKVLSAMKPNQIAALTLMLLPNTELYRLEQEGRFALMSSNELLGELRLMVDNISCRSQFQANHASNYLAINSRLPKDKDVILSAIDDALAGSTPLTPEFLRAL
jgi:radical SAM superfamily enzyme YgiQ (UPF0313 family)